ENSPGHEVLDTVFRHLNLLETAYFGLRYLDTANQPHWLDPTKKVARELKGTLSCTLYFGVKFYAADPCKLLEEITRYQFYLQVKQDILQGRLPISFDLAAELGAYVVQSELGDYDPRRHSPGYVSEFRFVSNQSVELECRIADLHKGLVGQLPADAELAYLDRVKWLDMYGVDLHPVLGEDNVEYFLGLTPSGIIVLRNKNKVGNYYWPRITKIYFKGRYFMLRVCDKDNEESTYGFETPSRTACKQLWKCCVEHHAFFRLVRVSPAPNDIFRLSSRFRYSGRTEKQARCDVEAGRRAPPAFERSPSRRQQRRVVEGAAVGQGAGQGASAASAHTPSMDEIENRENMSPQEKSAALALTSPTAVVTAPVPRQPSPPLSTRSAPWTEPHARGLYNSASSPRSLRSAASTGRIVAQGQGQGGQGQGRQRGATRGGSRGAHRRSSSVESHSSTDSRPCRRHRRHRSRKGSDSESEVSKCSERCHSRCRNRHHRHKSRHKSSNSGSRVELVDSTGQWREVQRRQAEGGGAGGGAGGGPGTAGPGSGRVQQAVVVSSSSRRSGYANSGADTETADGGAHGRHKRRLRTKHRSRSRSPSEGKRLPVPDELKQHLDFDLIDTEGMSEAQLREIPYTVVQTSAKPLKVKMSPGNRRRTHRSSRRSLKSQEDCGSTDRLSVNSQPVSRSAMSIPPLPFSPSASSLLCGGGAAGGGGSGGGGGGGGGVHRGHLAGVDRGSPRGSPVNNTPPAQGGSVFVPPLPRVPSAAQLNGANVNGGLAPLDQSQLPKYLKSYQGGTGASGGPQLQSQHQAFGPGRGSPMSSAANLNGSHLKLNANRVEAFSTFASPLGSSERLEDPDRGRDRDRGNDGVTSFMSNGTNLNRVHGRVLAQLPNSGGGNGGSGAGSPLGTRLWDEVKPSGGRNGSGSASASVGGSGGASSGRGSSASSSPAPAGLPVSSNHLHHSQLHHFGHRGSTGSSGSRRGSASPSPLPPIVTPHGVTFQQAVNNNGFVVGQHRGGGSVQSVKASVQNAAYYSMQASDPMLNGNDPTYRSSTTRLMNGGSGCVTETRTEL
ncbi:Band 4.1-like protein 4, partial [Frankliniella fusca]